MAAVPSPPADTAVQELDPICTGLDFSDVVPSPNRPKVPEPHVNNKLSDLIAAVKKFPAETTVQL